MTENSTYLYLDDIREPHHSADYTHKRIYIEHTWQVVRSYNEFVAWVTENGLPDVVSFDHDIADSHYTPPDLWDDYEASKRWQESQVHSEKTGYDCALWLVDYCMNNQLALPRYLCHSQNPVGKDKILGLLTNFEKFSC